ncbi:MAG: hypothetical protein OEW30_16525, partial [Acidimicrobiia bacterium]|nr:hypothetical protein [Acidimicrobiia bacterium]
MAGHICDNCGATVGDEQFCPTCGSWVDPLPGGNGEEFEQFSLGEAPPADSQTARIPRQETQCPSCGSPNPASNRHCENCGARLAQGALPVAPRPAVQTTAGVRAAMGISAVLLVVIIAVVIANVFGDDDAASTTTVAAIQSTTTARVEPQPLTILDVDCKLSSDATLEAIAGFECGKLIDGDAERTGEFQFTWTDLPDGTNPVIVLKFAEQVSVRSIVWTNIKDPTRFAQNYKANRV